MAPDADGHFGPIQLKRDAFYEFKGFDAQGALVGYQYFTPFKRSNRLVRMLSPSPNAVIAAASTGLVVRGPEHAALIARWDGGAFRQDLGASLTIDGTEVLTSENAGEEALAQPALDGGVVGFFMYDANTNGADGPRAGRQRALPGLHRRLHGRHGAALHRASASRPAAKTSRSSTGS